jgi:hypothetical protein
MNSRLSKALDTARPGLAKRACYFVLGSLLGGTIGYGFVTSGPGPAPSLLDPDAALWIFGAAVVCGVLAASSPDNFWRLSRRFGWRDRDGSDSR